LTHTGYQQIGARLTPEGLGYAYDDMEIAEALGCAMGISLAVVGEFANLAGDRECAMDVLAVLRSLGPVGSEVT
jgi:hypothetical protein